MKNRKETAVSLSLSRLNYNNIATSDDLRKINHTQQ
jgi:hypothetical protein